MYDFLVVKNIKDFENKNILHVGELVGKENIKIFENGEKMCDDKIITEKEFMGKLL